MFPEEIIKNPGILFRILHARQGHRSEKEIKIKKQHKLINVILFLLVFPENKLNIFQDILQHSIMSIGGHFVRKRASSDEVIRNRTLFRRF